MKQSALIFSFLLQTTPLLDATEVSAASKKRPVKYTGTETRDIELHLDATSNPSLMSLDKVTESSTAASSKTSQTSGVKSFDASTGSISLKSKLAQSGSEVLSSSKSKSRSVKSRAQSFSGTASSTSSSPPATPIDISKSSSSSLSSRSASRKSAASLRGMSSDNGAASSKTSSRSQSKGKSLAEVANYTEKDDLAKNIKLSSGDDTAELLKLALQGRGKLPRNFKIEERRVIRISSNKKSNTTETKSA